METTRREGDISFTFQGEAIKFDDAADSAFYRKQFQLFPNAKGVDFLAAPAAPQDLILLVEVKDCRGDERNNVWRVLPNNSGRDARPPAETGDSLDIEIAQKAAYTILCLYGAWTMCGHTVPQGRSQNNQELRMCRQQYEKFWRGLNGESRFTRQLPGLKVILFLEGEFGSDSKTRRPETKNKMQVRRDLQNSIQRKLSWLNCTVEVANSETYKRSSGYTIELHPHDAHS